MEKIFDCENRMTLATDFQTSSCSFYFLEICMFNYCFCQMLSRFRIPLPNIVRGSTTQEKGKKKTSFKTITWNSQFSLNDILKIISKTKNKISSKVAWSHVCAANYASGYLISEVVVHSLERNTCVGIAEGYQVWVYFQFTDSNYTIYISSWRKVKVFYCSSLTHARQFACFLYTTTKNLQDR